MRIRNNGNKLILMCSQQIEATHQLTPTTSALWSSEPTTNTTTTDVPTTTTEPTSLPTTTAATPTTTTIAPIPTTIAPTTPTSTTTTIVPTTTSTPTTSAPTKSTPTTSAPTTNAPTTSAPTTNAPTTSAPTTSTPTTTQTTTTILPKQQSYLRTQVDVTQEASKQDNAGFIVVIVLLSIIVVVCLIHFLYQKKIKRKRKTIVPNTQPKTQNDKIQKSIEKKQIIKRVRQEMKKANITTNRTDIPTHTADVFKISEVKPSINNKLKTRLPKRPKRPSELERMSVEDWRNLSHDVKGKQADKKVLELMQQKKVVKNSNFN